MIVCGWVRDNFRVWPVCTTSTVHAEIRNAATPSDNSGVYTAIKSPTTIMMMSANMGVLLTLYLGQVREIQDP